MKFEIQLIDEKEQLENIDDDLNEDGVAPIDLDDIGVGRTLVSRKKNISELGGNLKPNSVSIIGQSLAN